MNPPLLELFGDGYLAITFDQPIADERYQGIVPLEGKNLAMPHRTISRNPSKFRAWSALRRRSGRALVAGGLLFQHLPEGEEGRERMHTRLDHPTGRMLR